MTGRHFQHEYPGSQMDDDLFMLLPDPAIITDTDGVIFRANPAFYYLTGHTFPELTGVNIAVLEPAATLSEPKDTTSGHAEIISRQVMLIQKTGKQLSVQASSRHFSLGNFSGSIRTYRQTIHSTPSHAQLMLSDEKFSRVFHSSPDPILITELENGRINDINLGFTKLFGFSREEAIGKTTVELGLWLNRHDREININKVSQYGHLYNQEFILYTKQRNLLTVLSSSAIFALHGKTYIVAHLRDISERKQIESVLANSEARYRQFADELPLGIVITQDGMLKYVNNALTDMMGYSKSEFLNSSFMNYIHDNDKSRVAENHRRRMQGENVISPYQIALVTKSGDTRLCKIYASTLDWEGKKSGLGVIADVTDNLLFEERLQFSIHQLQEKEKAKTRFLAAASHDLRQPLHAMGLFVTALQERVQDVETRKIVQQLEASTEALRDLLNSLLDISRLDAGVVQPRNDSYPVQEIFDRLSHDYFPAATEKKISLRFTTHPYWVKSDASLLEQILRNLLSNAIRYTRNGGVLLGCRIRGQRLRFEVWDTGIGISPAELENIFHEFYQVGNPQRDRNLGLGLGLAISQRLAILLGTHIEVKSAPGKGSMFAFSVSISKQDMPLQGSTNFPAHRHFSNSIILVIDDEMAIRDATRLMLENWGCKVMLADSGEDAVELLQHTGTHPHAIIADYRLRNNRTGAEAISAIHQIFDPDIPAIIITGDTAPERLREAKESGYHLLHKPLAPAKLRTLLSHLLASD